jgi:hypothetical protein
MSSLRDFLNWFEGFSENLDKAPTAKQWEKIKERILALKDAPELAMVVAPAVLANFPPPAQTLPADVDPDPRGTKVVQMWKEKVLRGLEEVYDAGDARKILDTEITVDLNAEPAEVVQKFINSN